VLLAVAGAGAAEPAWDWLPRAADDDRTGAPERDGVALQQLEPAKWSARREARLAQHQQPGIDRADAVDVLRRREHLRH